MSLIVLLLGSGETPVSGLRVTVKRVPSTLWCSGSEDTPTPSEAMLESGIRGNADSKNLLFYSGACCYTFSYIWPDKETIHNRTHLKLENEVLNLCLTWHYDDTTADTRKTGIMCPLHLLSSCGSGWSALNYIKNILLTVEEMFIHI